MSRFLVGRCCAHVRRHMVKVYAFLAHAYLFLGSGGNFARLQESHLLVSDALEASFSAKENDVIKSRSKEDRRTPHFDQYIFPLHHPNHSRNNARNYMYTDSSTNSIESEAGYPYRLSVFYNMYVHQQDHVPWVIAMAAEQFKYLANTIESLFKSENHNVQTYPSVNVHVTNIGFQLNFSTDVVPLCQDFFGPDSVVSATHASEGSEYLSLTKLWDHCQEHPEENSIVTYMHSKGSYHPSQQNDRLRNFITRGATSKECVASVLGRSNINGTTDNICDVCSSRFSPLPHPHTSGNMWSARCSYIAKLPDPRSFEEQMNRFAERAGVSHYHPSLFGFERFSSEHWVHCYPSVKPCDVYPNDDFVWGYPKQDQVPEKYEPFPIKIHAAPRFGFETYISTWPNPPTPERFLVWRLQEYESLYNNTAPPSDWYGWSLYRRPYTARLWSGEKVRESHYVLQGSSMFRKTQVVEIVVAYCDADLSWLRDAISHELLPQANIRINLSIMSKCKPGSNNPQISSFSEMPNVNVAIYRLPNKGGCDLAYASFLSIFLRKQKKEKTVKSSYVLFLKDTRHDRDDGVHRSLQEMLQLAMESDDFICGHRTKCPYSPFHNTRVLRLFFMKSYRRNGGGSTVAGSDFNPHFHANLGDFVNRELNWNFPNEEVAEVCYSGTFAVPVAQLLEKKKTVLPVVDRLEEIMLQATTHMSVIEHYAERIWASLLAKPLTPKQVDTILRLKQSQLYEQEGHMGTLVSSKACITGNGDQKCLIDSDFDQNFYIKHYTDLKSLKATEALRHFLEYGQSEGRKGCKECCAGFPRDIMHT